MVQAPLLKLLVAGRASQVKVRSKARPKLAQLLPLAPVAQRLAHHCSVARPEGAMLKPKQLRLHLASNTGSQAKCGRHLRRAIRKKKERKEESNNKKESIRKEKSRKKNEGTQDKQTERQEETKKKLCERN